MSRLRDHFRQWRGPQCVRRCRVAQLLAAGCAMWPDQTTFGPGEAHIAPSKPSQKALLVVAHPDDESECAAILYRITGELGGIVDQVIVTNGESGFHWSGPAESFYGLPLAHETAARRSLPRIRRKEVLRANRILGVRDTWFFGQRDTGFTFNPYDGFRAWNTAWVRNALFALIEREQYDLVLTLLPAEDTHGHHQSVALLMLQAAAGIPQGRRPALAAVSTSAAREFSALTGFPITGTTTGHPVWSFDRTTPIAGSPLDYSIVVHWVIAEHKSQGMFQMEFGRRRFEHFWLFEASGPAGRAKWDAFITQFGEALPPQTPHREIRSHIYA
jgi:LmbE family N-acetylglucosaminyl deacetylase